MRARLRRLRRLYRRATRAFQFDLHAHWRKRPIHTGTVLYESFAGNGMLCNPEAIFRYLLKQPDFASSEHIWVLSDLRAYRQTMDEFKNVPNVRFVRYRSAAYFRALATSEFLVNNATFPPEFGKRPGQVYLNTWHGTPLKRMGYDMPSSGALEAANTLRNFVSADFLLAGNSFMATQMYEAAYRLRNAYRGLIIEEGYPRIDRQRLDESQFLAVRRRLEDTGLHLNGRDIVLYAPTWKGESFRKPEDDIEDLVAAVHELQATIGDRHVVLLKTHQAVHDFAVSNPALGQILVPNDIPTNLILGVSTALVTDYSSIFFDFLQTGRPIVFYTPDMTDYADTRGVYFPASQWPGPAYPTIPEVAAQLQTLLRADRPAPSEVYTDWQNRFTPYEDGEATRRVVDIVFRGRRRGYRVRPVEQDTRARLLLFLGGMRSNGIMASALNLLNALDHDRYDVSVTFAYSRKAQQRSNQEKIHPAVRQFPRVGGMNGSKFAHARRKLGQRRGRTDLHSDDRAQHSMWDEEWARCFADVRFDDVIDFSGYSPFWATLLLHSPPAARSIWLHNDLAADAEREVNGVKTMRRSLQTVFALYREFDHMVSVSPMLNEVNRRQLAAYAPAERFVAVRNLIDADRVLTGAKVDVRELEDHPRVVEEPGELVAEAPVEESTEEPTAEPAPEPTTEPTAGLSEASVEPGAVEPGAGEPADEEPGEVIIPEWALQLADRHDTRWFVSVGRLSPEKNQLRLIRAFAALYAQRQDVRLLIVGQGPLHERLQREVDDLDLSEVVSLTGGRQNPFAIMAASDCFVLSSNYEGQPMVLLEAAVVGMPIVSVDFASVHDALPNDSIHIVEQSDEALADGMRAFLRGEVQPSSIAIDDYTRTVLEEFERIVPATSHQERSQEGSKDSNPSGDPS